jgi:hypothetical protein
MYNREYYIYNIPVFVYGKTEPGLNIPHFCSLVESTLPQRLLRNVEVCYICEDPILDGRNATYSDGAIYMDINEPTESDLLENFIHEVAHSVEHTLGSEIFDDRLAAEFLGKRRRLYHLLREEGYDEIPEHLYQYTEYNATFDNFLANVVGYPELLSLTMGLFASPYGATSLQEYFANGFEKYYTNSPNYVKSISPILYSKIRNVLNND